MRGIRYVSPLAHLFTLLIRLYQTLLSPLFPGVCRYVPTCSQYTLDAVRLHGAVKGSYLGLKRIGSCHPISWLGGGSGLDPVPSVDSEAVPDCDHDHGASTTKLQQQ